jgi:hypothetical protein
MQIKFVAMQKKRKNINETLRKIQKKAWLQNIKKRHWMHKRETRKYLKLLTLPNSKLKIKIYGSKFYAMPSKGIEP